MASGGMAWLRLRGTIRSWRRIADAPGGSGRDDAPTSSTLEEALGADRGLVVVAGPSVVATAATVDRALRRMLGDHALVVVARPHRATLAEVLDAARPLGPVVVHVPDASPTLLSRITPPLLRLVDSRVRLVVTTRPWFLDALVDEEASAVLAAATVRLGETDVAGAEVGRAEVGARLDRLSATARAAALVVADFDRLGVALTVRMATALLPLYGPFDRPVPSTGAPGWSQWERHARRAVDTVVRTGDVRRRGGELVPAPALADHAASREAPRPSAGFDARVRTVLTLGERTTAGLVALARGDGVRAVAFLAGVDPCSVPRPAAAELVELACRRADVDEALRWYPRVGSGGEDASTRRARRSVALAEHRADRGEQHLAWLVAAGEDGSDAEVQTALARVALRAGERAAARSRFELAARFSGAEAAAAVSELAVMASEDGRDDDAEPLLRRVVEDPVRLRAVRARLVLVRMLRRQDRRVEALEAAEEAARWLETDDPPAWHAAVARELAALRRDGGDPDGAVVALRPFVRRRFAQALAACADLAELEARRGRWAEVLEAFPRAMPTVVDGSTGGEYLGTHASAVVRESDPVVDVADLVAVAVRGFLALARAAYAIGSLWEAMSYVDEVASRTTPSPSMSLLFGEIAVAAGRLDDARIHLVRAGRSSDVEEATRATDLLARVEVALEQLAAQRAAQLAAMPFHA